MKIQPPHFQLCWKHLFELFITHLNIISTRFHIPIAHVNTVSKNHKSKKYIINKKTWKIRINWLTADGLDNQPSMGVKTCVGVVFCALGREVCYDKFLLLLWLISDLQLSHWEKFTYNTPCLLLWYDTQHILCAL